MTESRIVDALRRFSTATLCSAHPGVVAMHPSITPLLPGTRICGPAKTAATSPGQNAAVHRAACSARTGDVLVVGGGDGSCGLFGDLLATFCRKQGVAGLVVDGAIRDRTTIREIGFPVFSLGSHPAGPAKSDPGRMDVDVVCGGVRVRPGDLMVGDADGVVVVPFEIAASVPGLADARRCEEEEIRARIDQGETTCDILGIVPGTAATGARDQATAPDFYNLSDLSLGLHRELAPGMNARIFTGKHGMLSIVTIDPNAEGRIHSHPEEQWGLLLDGDGVRTQGGRETAVRAGDFWRTPAGVAHGFRAGGRGARILDFFGPPRDEYRTEGTGFGAPAGATETPGP